MELKKVREQFSISSLVLGIISIVTMIFYYIAIPTSILAIIFGCKEYKNSKSKLALTGFILGIVGISLTGLTNLIFMLGIMREFL